MKLYVIGNGFDMHHRLNTSYTSFGLYLKKHFSEVYDLLVEHYGFEDLNPLNEKSTIDSLWSDFETNLASLDTQTVMEAHSDSLVNLAAEGFRDRDWGAFQIEMGIILKKLTVELFKAFKEFILFVRFPEFDQRKAVNLNKGALYLNFNYTDTLSLYYGIPDENILFIHEKAEFEGGDLVLGHGVDPKKFEETPAEPSEVQSAEEYNRWVEYQSDQYDHSYELGKETIMRYFTETFKSTASIIKYNTDFFEKLQNIDEVFILGHSLADVDLPYFEALVKSISLQAKWIATYHDDEDQQQHFNTLTRLGIHHVNVVKIADI
jgi:hypothetical protein